MTKKTQKVVVVKTPKTPKQTPKKKKVSQTNFGPVSTLSTAPVAIGNSIRGAESMVVNNGKNGITVRGRDYMFTPIGTSVTTWTLIGGTPLSPAAFADTTLANYMRMYAKFRFKYFCVHFITSSPTSATGDVMFYYGKDRASVFLNQTSSQLLGFVLSDPSTVIGPQWTNHSAVMKVTGDWKYTDYGMHDGLEEYADGELFLLARTATNSSPGYVLFDYVVEFAQHQLQPRLLTFPIPRIQWFQTNLGRTSLAVTAATTRTSTAGAGLVLTGNNLSGTAATVMPGNEAGDVYKVILDLTNSATASWTVATPSTLFQEVIGGAGMSALGLQDGMTLYAVVSSSTLSSNGLALYVNAEAAFLADPAGSLYYGCTGTITYNLQCWLSYIGTVMTKALVPNY